MDEGELLMENYERLILDVAEKSFADRGFANTKMMELAKTANVNHALIHYYYRSKDHLYECVVNRLFQKWDEDVKTFMWSEGTPQNVLKEYIKQYFDFYFDNPNFQKIRTWDSMEGKNLFQSYTEKFWREDLESKEKTIKDWKEKNLVRKDINARFILYSIWGLINYFYPMDEKSLQYVFYNDKDISENRELLTDHVAEIIIRQLII